MGYDSGLRRQR